MTFQVQLSAQARQQLLEIDEWWAVHRPMATGLVVRELEGAIVSLATTPYAVPIYQGQYRRRLLRRSGFHLYYIVDEAARIVVIAAIWNARRGHGPRLR